MSVKEFLVKWKTRWDGNSHVADCNGGLLSIDDLIEEWGNGGIPKLLTQKW